MVTKLYLVRHAEAEGNAEEFFQGNLDTALTEKGPGSSNALRNASGISRWMRSGSAPISARS